MDASLLIIVDMNDSVWKRFKQDLEGLSAEEVNWRPLPQANSINLIVRHLRIEAQWQVASLGEGTPMPIETTEEVQRLIDSVGFDFEENLKKLDELCTRFNSILRESDENTILRKNKLVYGDLVESHGLSPHFLAYHHPLHLTQHLGQVRTIRTLYRKTRGVAVPANFYPDNPTFPH